MSDTYKQRFAQQMVDYITQLARAVDLMQTALKVYWARGYGSDKQIAASDIENWTPDDVQDMLYLTDSLLKFLNGEDAPKGKFIDTINKYRWDI